MLKITQNSKNFVYTFLTGSSNSDEYHGWTLFKQWVPATFSPTISTVIVLFAFSRCRIFFSRSLNEFFSHQTPMIFFFVFAEPTVFTFVGHVMVYVFGHTAYKWLSYYRVLSSTFSSSKRRKKESEWGKISQLKMAAKNYFINLKMCKKNIHTHTAAAYYD